MSAVLITGANRGIGLGLVQQFAAHSDPPSIIIATCRNLTQSTELVALANSDKRIKVLALDVKDIASFGNFAEQVASIVGENGLNVLVNNAGVLVSRRASFVDASPEDYQESFSVNFLGPIFLTKALLPLIQKAADKNKAEPLGVKRAVVVNMSSLVGSLADNRSGGLYTYRESKAAINMFSVNLAKELKESGILVIPLHPGWVQTDMGGPNATITVEQSTKGMVDVIYKLDETKNGQFFNYDGSNLAW